MKNVGRIRAALVFCVLTAGCDTEHPSAPVQVTQTSSTLDAVCEITSELMGVERFKLTSETSLADLGADELDFVELIMEIEDRFGVTISDQAAEGLMGTNNWQQGMKNVTIAKLASLVDDERQRSPSGNTQPSRATANARQSVGPSENIMADSSPNQVKVFLNPLVMLLAGAEKQKGSPLTREEVLDIRENAAFVMMSPEQAQRFYKSLDSQVPVHRINPDRIWEEWQEIRDQIR